MAVRVKPAAVLIYRTENHTKCSAISILIIPEWDAAGGSGGTEVLRWVAFGPVSACADTACTPVRTLLLVYDCGNRGVPAGGHWAERSEVTQRRTSVPPLHRIDACLRN